jgi:hypothetical protein
METNHAFVWDYHAALLSPNDSIVVAFTAVQGTAMPVEPCGILDNNMNHRADEATGLSSLLYGILIERDQEIYMI